MCFLYSRRDAKARVIFSGPTAGTFPLDIPFPMPQRHSVVDLAAFLFSELSVSLTKGQVKRGPSCSGCDIWQELVPPLSLRDRGLMPPGFRNLDLLTPGMPVDSLYPRPTDITFAPY